MPSIQSDEISQCIELVTQLRSAIEFKRYHSESVPTLSDTLADWLVSAGKELCQSEEQSALNELRRTQSVGSRGMGAES